jgi:ligand-binding sensor domain-containing protein
MENGLVLYDRTEKLWTPVSPQGMISEAVTALAVTGSDVWIGARSGLNRMNRHLRVIEPVAAPALRNLRIFDLAVDDRWTLWVAASSGVFQHTPSGVWKKVEDTASSNLNGAVYDIEMDGDRIWFAIRHTLLRYDRNSGAWESYPTPLKIGDRPFEIRVSDRHIWVGSDRGGARFDKRTHIWTIFTGRDGLLDEAIQALAIEGDFIWFGSREGVTRFRWNDPTRVE